MSKPTTLIPIWQHICSAKTFSVPDLCNLGISRGHAYWYLKKMLHQGLIVCRQKRKSRRGYNTYSLAPGVSSEVPALSRKKRIEKTPRQKAWTTIRIFGTFRISDIQTATNNSYNSCLLYVRHLFKAGFIKILAKNSGMNGREFTYQLIQNTGPLAIQFRRDGSPIDPNIKYQ